MNKALALIVEDSLILANLFAAMLTDADYESVIVEDGQEVIAWLQDSVPDLILLDLNIPNVPGEKVLANIRANERFAGTRILVISGNPTRARQIHENVDLVLPKPIEYHQLRRVLRILHPDYQSTHIFSNRQNPSRYKPYSIIKTVPAIEI